VNDGVNTVCIPQRGGRRDGEQPERSTTLRIFLAITAGLTQRGPNTTPTWSSGE
jgi:hypothetical protein